MVVDNDIQILHNHSMNIDHHWDKDFVHMDHLK